MDQLLNGYAEQIKTALKEQIEKRRMLVHGHGAWSNVIPLRVVFNVDTHLKHSSQYQATIL